MNTVRNITTVLLLSALGASAIAQADKSREQVQAEWAEAQRSGNVLATGEAGLKLNELYPQRYAATATAAVAGKTREQVKAEVAQAMRGGELLAAGEASPERYPAQDPATAKTREQVKAELAEAQRNGDMLAGDDSGLTLREEYPLRYRGATTPRRAIATTDVARRPAGAGTVN
jgi:hypothetical protein